LLAGWARKQIKLGVSADWNAAACGTKQAGEVRGTNLWLDSTNLAKVGRPTTSRKSYAWSFKKGCIQEIWVQITTRLLFPLQQISQWGAFANDLNNHAERQLELSILERELLLERVLRLE